MKSKVIRSAEGSRLNVLGDNQTFKFTGADTGGLFTTFIQENPPGIQIPKHRHTREDEFFHVISGEVEFQIEDDIHSLLAGDMIFLPRGVAHSFKVVGNSPARVECSVYPSGLEFMFEELGRLPAGPPDLAVVAAICDRYGVQFV
ncbi:Cupin domain-containing protein [Chitinophaga jiangningensis]|uniref:Cupin domain-containing protein n=1 Tax=Chitinophaga jiangningensis TaxID=1419482 RepID=A0A1M6YW49_9BACT|nr:cupin domain-containing protein [Chitinophaga jiangningensis]SHL22325.1 Cupin domain-containing protein [Chitinophaga jiangningensis]